MEKDKLSIIFVYPRNVLRIFRECTGPGNEPYNYVYW